jgi:hypothetical protein
LALTIIAIPELETYILMLVGLGQSFDEARFAAA